MVNQLISLIDFFNAILELIKNITELSQSDALKVLSGVVFLGFFNFNFNFNLNINLDDEEEKVKEIEKETKNN